MINFRYVSRLTVAFFKRFRGLILIGIVGGISLSILFAIVVPKIIGSGTARIGVAGRFRPDTLPRYILALIGDGLTEIDESGAVGPSLATSWETSDKGKTWIFHLKEGVTWQDGEEVVSSDISYEFSDLTIETPDEATIVFKLENPFSPFPSVVARPTFKKGLLGTGEWEVSKISLSSGYVQEVILINKKKDKIHYKFYPTEERAKLAYKLGSVDKLVNIINPEPFDSWQTTIVTPEVDFGSYAAVFFNSTKDDRLMGEKSVRQALSYAIDKSSIGGERALSPIPPQSWAYNPQVKPYEYDKSRASELISDLPDEVTSGTVKLASTPVLLSQAEKIAEYWREIGIETTVQVSNGLPTDYQAFLVILDAPEDPDQYSLWHSSQLGTNISKINNPRIDKLLEDGRLELNQTERKKIYLDFQRFLVEEAPAAFLYHPTFYTIERK